MEADIDDMKEFSFEIGNSLEYISNYEGADLEDTLMVNFMIETDYFGGSKKLELIPNGEQIYVNQQNKHEYIRLFIDWFFNKQCQDQFTAFKTGFLKVASGDAMHMILPEELQLIICGSPNLDFKEL